MEKECERRVVLIDNENVVKRRGKNLIPKSKIKENMILVEGSKRDYIVPSGMVYADYGNKLYFPKFPYENKNNHYMYVNILFDDGKIRSRRLHVLLAKAFIYNPNPKIYNIVGHKNNIKSDNRLENLYWTTNQENLQKAVDDGLNKNKIAEENNLSEYIKVLDKDTLDIVGVYGSLHECVRKIENLNMSSLSKMYKKNKLYKPRSRKYIYLRSSKDEFDTYPNLQNIKLIENPIADKTPKVFRITNIETNQSQILDNQTTAEKITNVPQATISQLLKNKSASIYNGWKFEYISNTTFKNSSTYENQLDTVDKITVENIYDKRILEFNSSKELKDYFGLNGHDINNYVKNDYIMLSEWKIIRKSNDLRKAV